MHSLYHILAKIVQFFVKNGGGLGDNMFTFVNYYYQYYAKDLSVW